MTYTPSVRMGKPVDSGKLYTLFQVQGIDVYVVSQVEAEEEEKGILISLESFLINKNLVVSGVKPCV